MTTDQKDRKTLLQIKDLLDRADQLEAEARLEAAERRLNSSAGGSSSLSPEEGKKISYAEFMARRAGIIRHGHLGPSMPLRGPAHRLRKSGKRMPFQSHFTTPPTHPLAT